LIALLCSVQAEAEDLLASTIVTKNTLLGSKQLIEGSLGTEKIVLCIGGMGKVNAAHTSTLMLERFEPEVIVVFGIGGAYPKSGAGIGVAIARKRSPAMKAS
jgi:futalosine hydrolase